MNGRRFNLLATILLPIGLLVIVFGLASTSWAAPDKLTGAPLVIHEGTLADSDHATSAPRASHRLIVELDSPSLAVWSAQSGIARMAGDRLDFNAPAALDYIAQLQAEQAIFVSDMQRALPQSSVAGYLDESGQRIEATYQVVLNGIAIDPGSMDRDVARRELAKLPGVKAVHLDYAHEPTTYASLPLINAAAAWNNAAVGGQANAGAGVKVASMDGGLHHDAAMFDGTGFSYPAGWPAGGIGDPSNNNGKIIASRAYFRDFDPPAVGDENTWPGVAGTSHGTHTGSTAAGNSVVADYLGITNTVSGVAPAAWAMSYRVFYGSVLGDGSFHDVEGVAALEDIVMDGADVLNNSWGGGPGSVGGEFDLIDSALINAAEAGIFVSMSAGNAGPGTGTTDHPSDDYIVVAATTSGGTYASGRLNITKPEPITTTLQGLSYSGASFGGSLPIGAVITHTYVAAINVDPGNFDGCSAWPAGTFTGVAAVISRGSCEFGVKVLNAEQGGADFVVIYNNAGDGLINMGAGVVGNMATIPSIFVGQTDGLGIVAWHTTHGAASVLEIDTFAFQSGNVPDVVASFSSRGPGVGNVLKPDIAAPGVNILAQGYMPGASGEDRHLGYGQASGTSMASPHIAGSAALLRQIHPGWTNAEIKSALMSTSKYLDVYNARSTQPLDIGAGRVDLTKAADPGVILDPPSLSFGMVPTGTMTTISVGVTSVATTTEVYSLSTVLVSGSMFTYTTSSPMPGFTTDVMTMTLGPGETGTFEVTFDPASGTGIGDNQGYLTLESAGFDAHMPAWARVAPPPAAADVLIIKNDAASSLARANYLSYYTSTLDTLGLSYWVWDADANFANPTTIPDAATLSAYEVVIYYTGDNYQPDGTFTVSTALTELDMNRLTEYANNGGILFAMGQDLASVLNSATFDDGEFLYSSVLGGNYYQDSVTGFILPSVNVIPMPDAPHALQGVSLDLGGADDTTVTLSGANEFPPVATTVLGEATFSYNNADMILDYAVSIDVVDPLTITASHIHSGTSGANGPVVFATFPFTEAQVVTDTIAWGGQATVDITQEVQLLAGDMYLNVHSTANPSGEVRGQVEVTISGDGAGNQIFIDEIQTFPNVEPDRPEYRYPYVPLMKYPGPFNIEDGVVAMAHRDQPSLERPEITYFGRSIYTTFGLEGVNNAVGSTSREDLLSAFMDWAMDEPTVDVLNVTGTYTDTGQPAVFQADLTSNITGTTGVSYRWDFGDGTEYAGPYTSNTAGHRYELCGYYDVTVEVTDSWGNRTLGTKTMLVSRQCDTTIWYLPMVLKD